MRIVHRCHRRNARQSRNAGTQGRDSRIGAAPPWVRDISLARNFRHDQLNAVRRSNAHGAPACKARRTGGKRGRARRHSVMHEINVTPFVDVMLVLLIVFMVAAPLLLSGLPVDLPASKGQSLSQAKDPITVTVDRNGKIYLGIAGGADRGSRRCSSSSRPGQECRGRSDPVPRRPPGRIRPRVGSDQRRARGRLQEVHLRQRPRGHRAAPGKR